MFRRQSVTDVLGPHTSDEASAHLNHVVELQSLDEDRLGEQLSVIWELEVGQTVTPAQGLPEHINPDGFDDPSDLAGFIDAMRWGAVTSADPNRYQAPFWSGAAVDAYQLEPLRRALASPRANPLLADDVGRSIPPRTPTDAETPLPPSAATVAVSGFS